MNEPVRTLVCSGPPDWGYAPVQGGDDQDRQRHWGDFYQWVLRGLTFSTICLFGLGYSDEAPKPLRGGPKLVPGFLNVVMPTNFPLAHDIRLALQTREASPYFPRYQLGYLDGKVPRHPDTMGVYFEPKGYPKPGYYVGNSIDFEDPPFQSPMPFRIYGGPLGAYPQELAQWRQPTWLYWPQQPYCNGGVKL
jgi:hypothetical protein